MYESKHPRLLADDKHTRSSHALVDRTLLKNMQNDITHATELISALRDEKDKLKKSLQQLQHESHEKNNIIRSLKNRIKYMETIEEDDDVVKELNQANLKLKNEIELSLHGIVHKPSDLTTEIISLTEFFLNKVHSKTRLYQVYKSHMKSSNNFKQIIGHENWGVSTLQLLRFFKDIFSEEEVKFKVECPDQYSDEEYHQENINKIIQDSKEILDTLSYRKNKLEDFNQEFAIRGSKLSPTGSPLYKNGVGNMSQEKSLTSPDNKKELGPVPSFHTANKLAKNVSRFKNNSKK